MSAFRRALDWLDDRSGYRDVIGKMMNEPVVGGARWSYVFGSALVVVFILQAATGVVLATYYSPSATQAWSSVAYIQDQVRLGWLLRGLHHWGSSAMVALLIMHVLQVFTFGAYKAPRELNWWSGVVLLLVTFGFALTGYLLPWDQKGYWATQVVTGIIGSTPVVGGFFRDLMQGGNEYGNLTLTRFYAMHVFLLPGALMMLLLVHLHLFRRHVVTPTWHAERIANVPADPFWPDQIFKDVVFAAFITAVLFWLALREHGAPLEAPADPSSNFLARPEWYFLFLFELLKHFHGPLEVVGTLVVPTLLLLAFVALPLGDRGPSRDPRKRFVHFGIFYAGFIVWIALTAGPMAADARDPAVAKQRELAEGRAARARSLAREGVPPGGGLELWANDPIEDGKKLFATHCLGCHKRGAAGGDDGPDLNGYLDAAWVRGLVEDPSAPRYFGKKASMDGYRALGAEKLDRLTAFMLNGDSEGRKLFESEGCADCHATTPGEESNGPNLAGYGTSAWMKDVIAHPKSPLHFGPDSKMPEFAGKLDDRALEHLVAFLEQGDE